MCASFGDPRSRDSELTRKKTLKMRFSPGKFINSPIAQKPLGMQS